MQLKVTSKDVLLMLSSTRPLKSKFDVLNVSHVVMLALHPEPTTTADVPSDDDDDQPLQDDAFFVFRPNSVNK